MDWDRAKNIIILMLLLLNGTLGGLILWSSPPYSLTAQREQAILDVLAGSGIQWEAKLPRRFPPTQAIRLTAGWRDPEALAAALFLPEETVTQLDLPDRSVLVQGAATLVVENGAFRYENPNGLGRGPEACQEIIAALGLPGFIPDGEAEQAGALEITYRQLYKNRLIYTNHITFSLARGNILRVTGQYGHPAGLAAPIELLPPDEAVFTFMVKLKNMYGDAPLTVNRMDLVFRQREEDGGAGELRCAPYYRFYTSQSPEPIFINGYTGAAE
jgi:hypothetical protein